MCNLSELVLEQGEYTKLISQIRKKIKKQLSATDCAEMLDEDLNLVIAIYQWIEEDPELDDRELYQKHKYDL